MPSDFKAPPRHRSRSDWNAIVRTLIQLYRECEAGCGHPAASGHHVVKRGKGDDVRENCVVLCGTGTTGCHGAVEGNVVVRDGVRITPGEVKSALRARFETVRRDVRSYVVATENEDWLDRTYPSTIMGANEEG